MSLVSPRDPLRVRIRRAGVDDAVEHVPGLYILMSTANPNRLQLRYKFLPHLTVIPTTLDGDSWNT